MKKRLFLTLRILLLILVLPILGFALSPPVKTFAQCSGSGNISVDNGLISVSSNLSNFAPTSGANVSCISGNPASISQYSIPSYNGTDGTKTLYYDQAKSDIHRTLIPGNASETDLNGSADLLFNITGDLVIGGNISNNIKVVFVDGNLYINHDITNNSADKGLVFVVQGSIYINRSVTKVNAFLISHGKRLDSSNKMVDTIPFCSAWNGVVPPTPDDGTTTCIDDPVASNQKQLIINGSVVSLNATLPPQFVRKYFVVNQAAELINYEPKYLAIMKDAFSRDVKIWREIQ